MPKKGTSVIKPEAEVPDNIDPENRFEKKSIEYLIDESMCIVCGFLPMWIYGDAFRFFIPPRILGRISRKSPFLARVAKKF